jgi:hypothetical protein
LGTKVDLDSLTVGDGKRYGAFGAVHGGETVLSLQDRCHQSRMFAFDRRAILSVAPDSARRHGGSDPLYPVIPT